MWWSWSWCPVADRWVDRPGTFTSSPIEVSGSCPEASSSSCNLVTPGSASNTSPATSGAVPRTTAGTGTCCSCHDISPLGDPAALARSQAVPADSTCITFHDTDAQRQELEPLSPAACSACPRLLIRYVPDTNDVFQMQSALSQSRNVPIRYRPSSHDALPVRPTHDLSFLVLFELHL